MGIIGHKERALIRRGLYVQETLKSRDLIAEDDQLDLFDNQKIEDAKIKIYEIVTEDGKFKTKNFRDFILFDSGVYPKCSPEVLTTTEGINKPCVGRIDSENCKTGYGVIGGKYTSESRGGVGLWSVINFFDTNSQVHSVIKDIYQKENTNLSLNEWVNVNIKNLVGDDGIYTSELADKILTKNSGTRFKGNKNEEVIVNVLEKNYPGVVINRFCDGDERDRLNGQDLMVTLDGVTKYFQVKPLYGDIILHTKMDGDTYFEIKSYDDILNKYSPNNVQKLAFVNGEDYIIFDYKKDLVTQELNPVTYSRSPKFLLKFKNEFSLKSPSLKIKEVDELKKMSKDDKIKILNNKLNDYKSLIYDYNKKIKYIQQAINNLSV
jgi:hypothetical protein